IKDVADFVNDPANSKEVLILSFRSWCNMTDAAHQDVVNELKNKLGSKIAERGAYTAETTLEQFWANGKQVVVVYDNDNHNEGFFDTPADFWKPDSEGA